MQHHTRCSEGWLDLGKILQYLPRIPANSEIWHLPICTITPRGVEKDQTLGQVSCTGFRTSLWMQHLCVEGWLDLGEILQYHPRIPANSEIRHPPICTITPRGVEKDQTLGHGSWLQFRLMVPRIRSESLLLLGLLDFSGCASVDLGEIPPQVFGTSLFHLST